MEIRIKSKIYISGKISGLHPDEVTVRFYGAELRLYDLHGKDNVTVINPIFIEPFLGVKKWLCYMITDLIALSRCHAIYMLCNWPDSKGARIEHWFAKQLKLKIIYENR
jgi:hypothetical protein